ncbi:MAG: N-acetylglucosamine kinase [Bacteroidota bacterium]
MARKQFVLGLDGGGTKTAAALADLQGNVLAEEVGGPSNFQLIGVEKAAETLLMLADSCCQKAGLSLEQVKTVAAGLTGAGRPSDQRRMQEGFEKFVRDRGATFEHVIIESDARIALEGAFKGGGGMILICGTGSIALGKSFDGRIFRVGGWGRILGDEGSGYAIGRDGLNAVTRHLDGRGKKTLLTEIVGQRFNLKTQEEIIAAVYRENFDVASVAPLVIEAAEQHDTECERILNKATFELTEHVRALTLALEKASSDRPRQKLPLAFIGSVIAGDTVFTKILKHKIEFSLPQIRIVQPQSSPAYGAVLIALSNPT